LDSIVTDSTTTSEGGHVSYNAVAVAQGINAQIGYRVDVAQSNAGAASCIAFGSIEPTEPTP
jgi:hypothetical protein